MSTLISSPMVEDCRTNAVRLIRKLRRRGSRIRRPLERPTFHLLSAPSAVRPPATLWEQSLVARFDPQLQAVRRPPVEAPHGNRTTTRTSRARRQVQAGRQRRWGIDTAEA
jgi:hypothetical protein